MLYQSILTKQGIVGIHSLSNYEFSGRDVIRTTTLQTAIFLQR